MTQVTLLINETRLARHRLQANIGWNGSAGGGRWRKAPTHQTTKIFRAVWFGGEQWIEAMLHNPAACPGFPPRNG
jgi:hypothetical protein